LTVEPSTITIVAKTVLNSQIENEVTRDEEREAEIWDARSKRAEQR
jgi:hypothetical protein